MDFQGQFYDSMKPDAGQFSDLDFYYSVDCDQYHDTAKEQDSLCLPCYDHMLRHSKQPDQSSSLKSNLYQAEHNIQEFTMVTEQYSIATCWNIETMYEDSAMTLNTDTSCDCVDTSVFSTTDDNSYMSSDSEAQCVPECTVLTREVEGCEEATTNVSDLDNSCHMYPSVPCKQCKSSSNCKFPSHPLALSTMIEDMLVVNKSYEIRRRNGKVPCASSTMIEDDVVLKTKTLKPDHSQCFSEVRSVYTWTIQDISQQTALDESYVIGHHKVVEPSTAYIKLLKVSNRNNGCPKISTTRRLDRIVPCDTSAPVNNLSMNDTPDGLHDRYTDTEFLYDEKISSKPNCLPRTSTKINLCEDIEDFHSVPNSSGESGDLIYENLEQELPPFKKQKGFKFTKSQLRKLFSFKRSKGKNSKSAKSY